MASAQRVGATPVRSLSCCAVPSGPARLHGVVRMSRPVAGSAVMPNVLSIHMDSGSLMKP
jgi:hypothetical protein